MRRSCLLGKGNQVLELTDLRLDEIVNDLIRLVRRVIGGHITIKVISESDLHSIRADKSQIEQILMNLCINARDAMGEGGTITLTTDNVELDRAFCQKHRDVSPGRYVVLRVADTGCGIDPETQRRIFDPFFTTKKLGEGTGLGLSTVFGIVSQHRGLVDVESVVGSGTTFRVYLPVSEISEQALPQATKVVVHGGTETILLADDDEGVRQVAETMLCNAGYAVLSAANGKEAIRLFEEHIDEIDLALLDVVMPEVGGKAVAERIMRERPDMPVIFSSGYSGGAVHSRFTLDEGVPLIPKPYSREDLLLAIRDALVLVGTTQSVKALSITR
ncbi:MAG: ATP-binding protein [Gammaproteobacteria bacterium]|nr:ATP-binding protein [Gammaproteobacteria bacterium]